MSRHLICGNIYSWLLNLHPTYETPYDVVGSGFFYFNIEITQLVLFDLFNNSGAIYVTMDGFIAKTAAMEFGAFICSMAFLSLMLVCISTNLLYGLAWNTGLGWCS